MSAFNTILKNFFFAEIENVLKKEHLTAQFLGIFMFSLAKWTLFQNNGKMHNKKDGLT